MLGGSRFRPWRELWIMRERERCGEGLVEEIRGKADRNGLRIFRKIPWLDRRE